MVCDIVIKRYIYVSFFISVIEAGLSSENINVGYLKVCLIVIKAMISVEGSYSSPCLRWRDSWHYLTDQRWLFA